MKKLYYIRHGLSQLNVSRHFAGITNSPLTQEGRQQAKLAGKQAKNLNIDYIVCSQLSRALDTAKIIAKEIGYPIDKIHINKLFIERDFGELEGKPWKPDFNLDGITDIETVDSLIERARLGLKFLQALEADNILVVSHGTIGRAFRSLLLPEQPFLNATSSKKSAAIPNAKIVSWPVDLG